MSQIIPGVPEHGYDDLPAPWIRQFDDNYQTFFYINPTTDPPTTSWTRPGQPENQIHPEQADAYRFANENVQQDGSQQQGHAADYLNSGSTDSPVPGNPNPNANYGQQGGEINAGTGERGIGSMMVNQLMGKQGGGYGNQYGNQGYNQYGHQGSGHKMGLGSAMGAGGGLATGAMLLGKLLGGKSHHGGGYSHNMGPPPFGGGGMGGGLGGLGSLLGGGGGHHGGHHGGGGGFGGGGGMFGMGGGGPGFGGGGGYHGGGGGHHGGPGGFGGGPGGFGGGGGGRW